MLNVKMLNDLFHLITVYLFAIEGADNTGAGLAITIRIDGLGHLLVGHRGVKEHADLRDNEIVVGANEMDSTALKGLRALSGVAHHKDGLTKTRSFLLNTATVGEHYSALLHQVNELEILQGLDEEEIGAREVFAKHLVNGLAHIGVEVHGIDEIDIGILLGEILHGGDHADEAITEILATVAGDQDELARFLDSARNDRSKAGYVIACGSEDVFLLGGKLGVVL